MTNLSVPRLLLLNGSPSRSGNAVTLARLVAQAAGAEMETVHLYDEGLLPCRDCGVCHSRPCEIDTVMRDIMSRAAEADCLVLASPLHFTSLTAPMIAFISRLQQWWRLGWMNNAPRRLRCGALVVVGGGKYDTMFRPARSVAAAAFTVLGIEFAGMATAADTDTVAICDNEQARRETNALAERIRLCSSGS